MLELVLDLVLELVLELVEQAVRVLTDMLMLKPLPVDRSAADASISVITFIVHTSFTTHELAHVLDSLVRVSRRVE